MAIQLPKITADPNVQQDTAPRIQTQGIDAVTPMTKDEHALTEAGDQMLRFGNEVAYQHADTLAANARNEFLEWDHKRRYGDPSDPTDTGGLLNETGDPHANFNRYVTERNQKLKDLSTPPDGEDWSTMTQKMVNRRLNRADEETQLEMLTQYGHAYQKWQKNSDDSSEMLIRQALPFASSQIKINPDGTADPSSFDLVNRQLDNLRQLKLSQALRNHQATVSPDGSGEFSYRDESTGQNLSLNLSDMARSDLNSSIGRATTEALQNLVYSAGPQAPQALAQAKAFRDRYGSMIDQYDNGSVYKSMKTAEVEEKANQLSFELRGKTPDQVDQALSKEDPEVARKAAQYMKEYGQSIEEMRKLRQEKNNDALQKFAIGLKQQNPASTMADLQQSTQYKQMAPNLTTNQLKSVENFMKPSSTTSVQAFRHALNILDGQDPEVGPDPSKITADQLFRATAELGTDANGKFMDQRLRDLAVPSLQQRNAMVTHANATIKSQAMSMGIVRADNQNFTDVRKDGDEADLLNHLQLEFTKQLMAKGGGQNYQQIEQSAKDFLTQQSQLITRKSGFFGGSISIPAAKTGLQIPGANPPPAPGAPPPGKTEIQVQAAAKNELQNILKRPPNANELKDYVDRNRARLSK